jgi:hypothetical protein
MQDQFSAKIGIFSETITPDRISEIVGIKPDKIYIKGDRRGKSSIKQKENGWIIYSRIRRDSPLQDHISDLFERIYNKTDEIAEITKQPNTEVELGCTVWSSDRPPLYFTKEQISIISKIQASLDIDLYLSSSLVTASEEGNQNNQL